MDWYGAGYSFGSFSSFLILVAVVGLIIWAITKNNSNRPTAGMRNPMVDLELLGRTVTLHTDPERAAAVVAQIAASSGRLMPSDGATPTWRADGGYPVVTLEHTPAGSVLGVSEVVVPLRSPDGAILWQWLLGAVDQAARAAGVPVSGSARRFVPGQQIDAYSSIWIPG